MHKIVAYLLLVIGLTLLFTAFTGMYQTFVQKKPVVQILHMQPVTMSTPYGTLQLDSSAANQVLNLGMFALFMIFLTGLGGAVLSAGNQLLKTERICDTLQTLRRTDVLAHEKDIQKL